MAMFALGKSDRFLAGRVPWFRRPIVPTKSETSQAPRTALRVAKTAVMMIYKFFVHAAWRKETYLCAKRKPNVVAPAPRLAPQPACMTLIIMLLLLHVPCSKGAARRVRHVTAVPFFCLLQLLASLLVSSAPIP